MQLENLIGGHLLDAVDRSTEEVKESYGFENCDVLRFRLDGKAYSAIEDPDDGYRSMMRDIAVSDRPMTNVFAPVRVIARHRTEGRFSGEDDVLELIDAETGKLVLEVGTEDVDDYYPSFIAAFHPENMTPNAEANRRSDRSVRVERPVGRK